ncbi:MAG: DNA primase [Clostridia bacterium]|nr:DNA primase [Clostridia bacterium]
MPELNAIPDRPDWLDHKGRINEVMFADHYLSRHPMRCIGGRLFTVDGLVEDENALRWEIYGMIRVDVTTGLAKRTSQLLEAIKLACHAAPLPVQRDRIHVANGTYFLDGHFEPVKEFCHNRLPAAYLPEAGQPVQWLRFLDDLLEAEDIPALQEFFGYALLPVTKAQKMLILIGKGGEGKSRVGLVLRSLLGENMNTGSIQKVETDRFARADLEYKLLMVDDDLRMEALTETHHLKSMVTLEDRIDIERKGVQSTQGVLYVRFACFGNGTLHALYDRSNGFYRRQLLITVKERKADRQDDPYLIEKLRSERDGILLWALEGLQRLIANGYQFTISPRMEQNLEEAVAEGNNLVQFMESTDYIVLEKDAVACSTALYRAYGRWCEDNLEKPLSQKSFTQFLRQNESTYGITYSKHAMGDQRGFHGIHVKYLN